MNTYTHRTRRLPLVVLAFVLASCSGTEQQGAPSTPAASVVETTADTLSDPESLTSVKPGKVYAIGEVGPGGGIVFITPSTEGNSTNQYFEAAPYAEWPEGVAIEDVDVWCSATDTLLGADGTAIGTGATNTATAADSCSSGAIHMASIYSNNGFSDWFLPSQDELNELYLNKELVGGFSTGYYWSSSEYDADFAWLQYFDYGNQLSVSKISTIYVPPVRAFS